MAQVGLFYAHNTISTFDLLLLQSLHNVKMLLDVCIEVLQDALTLMQAGKLCRYVYRANFADMYTERSHIYRADIQSGRTEVKAKT